MIAKLKIYAALLGLFITTLLTTWFGGKMAGKNSVKIKLMADELDAHERINNANLGGGATDAERIKRLQHMADKLGN